MLLSLLQEHLGGDYKVAWSTVGHPWLSGIKGVHADEAVADDGASRWDNFVSLTSHRYASVSQLTEFCAVCLSHLTPTLSLRPPSFL